MPRAQLDHERLQQDPVAYVGELELRRRILAAGFMLIFSLAITGSMGVMALMDGHIGLASTMFGIALTVLGAYLGINLVKPNPHIPLAVGGLLMLLYFYLLLSGGVNNTGLLWAVMLVPGFINLFGYRNGALALAVLGALTCIVLFYPEFPGLEAKYDVSYRARFLAVFVALTVLTAILDTGRHQTQQALRALTRELESQAGTDALTGLANRREAERAIMRLMEQGEADATQYTVLIGDLDNFKQLNDEHGHALGDKILREVADMLRQHTRGGDLVARWGGEEFLVLLPDTGREGARLLAEKLRGKIMAIGDDYVPPLPITISFGVSGGMAGASADQSLAEADRKMYVAKQAGRNRVEA
ncbi:GGDEF domain-containing protein [Biformimicrobium ophioploci]|uniref:diguanylate cyclase n=1 Tax=Biformimicrobium ophioploci TaxID=3036711 RepID=A0ABQ6LVZ0_9GAMM|nr:GGDEF domain-containing protein [Microbulbifer sp. NKW57]GMG86226.1 GGDEF domain-containing protein [Microbulbifer sp. NKW57]